MVDKLNFENQSRIVGSAAVGVDPRYMIIGLVFAISELLDQTGYRIEDIELFEINQAFALLQSTYSVNWD